LDVARRCGKEIACLTKKNGSRGNIRKAKEYLRLRGTIWKLCPATPICGSEYATRMEVDPVGGWAIGDLRSAVGAEVAMETDSNDAKTGWSSACPATQCQ
jgi:hypothetical protein